MKKQEREFWIALAALIISVLAALFTGLQWEEARQTRIDVHNDAEKARAQADEQFKTARQDAQSSAKAQEAQVTTSATAAERSARAAEKSTTIAGESMQLNRQLFEASQRASVHVKTIRFTVKANELATVTIEIENAGKTTAKHTTCIVNIHGGSEPPTDNLPDLSNPKVTPTDLVAGEIFDETASTVRPITPDEVTGVSTGRLFLIGFGHIDYLDAFGHPHKTTFCALYNPQDPGKPQVCGHFNSVD